jgi:hypothetical protein
MLKQDDMHPLLLKRITFAVPPELRRVIFEVAAAKDTTVRELMIEAFLATHPLAAKRVQKLLKKERE